ncbi:MAG: hypothetical protein N2Z20_04800 [Elusimicrobiales bacterium]|nr:hypothetical protein [Elusimicrobiales bacterium]
MIFTAVCSLIIFFNLCFGSDLKLQLSELLLSEYLKRISITNEGKKIADKVRKDDIKIYFEYADDKWLAWYESKGRIFFNLKYLMIFFSIEDYNKQKIEMVMRYSDKVRNEFVKYTDFLFVHEIIHYIQDKKYKEFRSLKNEFVEFEYEAYILTDIYFYERMIKERKLFLDLLSGKYYDLYSGYAMGGFISSIDLFENYLKAIKERYLDEVKGYVTLTDEDMKRKVALEEKKIISYASGKKEIYEKTEKEYENFSKAVKDYLVNINKFLRKKWEKYIMEALPFISNCAIESENYHLLWKSCYFLKKLYDKNCLDGIDKEKIFNNFAESINKRDNQNNHYSIIIEELYWYKKFIIESKTNPIKLINYDSLMKNAIIECDRRKDKKCLKMIDEIYEFIDFDLIK